MVSEFLHQLQLVSKDELPPSACCAICLNKIPELAARLICGHVIGLCCINTWLTAGNNPSCPKCGYPVSGQNDDEAVDSASGTGLRTSFIARVDARPILSGDQHTIDRPSQVDQSPSASTDAPFNAQRSSGYGYVPYRPSQYTPASSGYSEAPYQSHYPSPPGAGYSHQPSDAAGTTASAARPTRNARHTAFIPSDFGLPPPMVRHSLAALASPPRHDQISLPASLVAGQASNIQTTHYSKSPAAPPLEAQESLPSNFPMVRPTYSLNGYIPYRPESYSSVSSSSSSGQQSDVLAGL